MFVDVREPGDMVELNVVSASWEPQARIRDH